LLELNRSSSGADVDSGIYVQRGSAGNSAILYWNEGEDKFKAVLSTSAATVTAVTDSSKATIVANYEGDTLTVGSVSIVENEIRTNNSNDSLQLGAAGTGNVIINDAIVLEDNEIRPARTNDDLVLTGVGTGVVRVSSFGFADSTSSVTGISPDGALGGDAPGVYTNASNSLLVTEEAVKRYVDGNADIYLQIDITGLAKTGTGAGTVQGLLTTLAPVANFAGLTKAYVAATTSTKDTLSVTVGSVGSIGNVVSGVVTAVSSTVANPTRDNDLIYRVNAGATAWEYVSGA